MRSIKVVGVSGSGKSTLIRGVLQRLPQAVPLGYSQLAAIHGVDGVEVAWRAALDRSHGLYLIDDHLEFGGADLLARYREENTAAIFCLDPSVADIEKRRAHDASRQRDNDRSRICHEARLSRARAIWLSTGLHVPLLFARDETVEVCIKTLVGLIQNAG